MSSPYDDGWLLDQLATEIRERDAVRRTVAHRNLKPENVVEDAPTAPFARPE